MAFHAPLPWIQVDTLFASEQRAGHKEESELGGTWDSLLLTETPDVSRGSWLTDSVSPSQSWASNKRSEGCMCAFCMCVHACMWVHASACGCTELGRVYVCLLDFPHSSVGKSSASNAEALGSIPESGRSTGEESGYPLQDSSLGNPWTEEPGGPQSMDSQELDMT